jgi:hypothetical protein
MYCLNPKHTGLQVFHMRNDAMYVEVEPAADSPDLLSVKEQVLRLGHAEQERLYSWMHYALNHRIYK